MSRMQSVTGESLHEDNVQDTIPGATPFFKVDLNEVQEGEYEPLKELPSNPHEYLKSVMQEARNIPDVVVAKIDPRKIKSVATTHQTQKYTNERHQVHVDLLPPKAWQQEQLASFATAREEFIRHLAKLKSISRQTKKRPKLPIYPLPSWDDDDSWRLLCFGKALKKRKRIDSDVGESTPLQKSTLIDGEISDVSDDFDHDARLHDALAASGKTTADIMADQIAEEEDDRRVDLATLEEGFPPMMRILLRMDANQVEANLEYHARWLEEYGFSHEQGRWIYALLTCLEKPLFPTVVSCLRELSRKCLEIRSKLDQPSDVHLNGLNLIILVVGRYFDQIDLSDPS